MVKQQHVLKRRILTEKQLKKPNFYLGDIGEKKALEFLESRGYRLIEKNLQFNKNEVDIICLEKETNDIVFVEVKTRSSNKWGDPSLAVNRRKIASMIKIATRYLKKNSLDNDYRFDIISVLPNKIEHFKNITWP